MEERERARERFPIGRRWTKDGDRIDVLYVRDREEEEEEKEKRARKFGVYIVCTYRGVGRL